MDRNLIMLIILCKLNYVKLKNLSSAWARSQAARTGSGCMRSTPGSPTTSAELEILLSHNRSGRLANQSGGLFSRKKPYQEVP